MKSKTIIVTTLLAIGANAVAQNYVSQPPLPNGGVFRWSQLWIDPSPAGNDLDSDAICYSGFTLNQNATIKRLDWWGKGAHELGFQLEIWRQDPGTIAYQPLGVFREQGAHPDWELTTNNYHTEAFGNFLHHWIDLPNPVQLAANNSSNPRWFFSVIANTGVPYATWDWAQATNGTGTFYWIRGQHMFFLVGDPRAFKITGDPVPEPATMVGLIFGAGFVGIRRLRK